MTGKNDWCPEVVSETIADLKHKPGPLLPILHEIQHRGGYIPAQAVPLIAEALNLSRAEVHGVISFYHDFRDTRPGHHRVQICQAEACQSVGSARLSEHARTLLGIDFDETTADGRFTLDKVYCLGNCACGPSVMIDGEVRGRVTPERFEQLMQATGGGQ